MVIEDGFVDFSCSCRAGHENYTAAAPFEHFQLNGDRDHSSVFCKHFVPLVLLWYRRHPEAAQYSILEPVLNPKAVISIELCASVLRAAYGSAGLHPDFIAEIVQMSNATELSDFDVLRQAKKYVARLKDSSRTDFAVIAAMAEMGLYGLDRTFSHNVRDDECDLCGETEEMLKDLLASAAAAGAIPGPELARMLVMGLAYSRDGKWGNRVELRNKYGRSMGDSGLAEYDRMCLHMLSFLGPYSEFNSAECQCGSTHSCDYEVVEAAIRSQMGNYGPAAQKPLNPTCARSALR